jgi:hypothetical protein
MKTKNATKTPLIFRQGDVLMELLDACPAHLTELPRGKRGVVLAEGEVTGHAHRIANRSAKLYRSETDQRFLRVTAPVALRHEEHTTVTLPAGNYRVHIHHEYAPDEIRRVED